MESFCHLCVEIRSPEESSDGLHESAVAAGNQDGVRPLHDGQYVLGLALMKHSNF